MMTLDHAETPLASAAGEVREIGSLVTACFMADRRRWGLEPLCDPAFFIYFEDHALGLRARLLGWRLLTVPAASALHGKGTPGMSLRATGRFTQARVYHTIRNRWQMILKFYQPGTLVALAPALLLFELFQLAGALRRGWLGHYWRAAAWFVASRRDLGERRRQIQSRRKLPDTAILSGGPPPFAGPLLTGGIERAAARLLARAVEANWALASRLLGAAA
jgi:GT2 family glycosyltransferase